MAAGVHRQGCWANDRYNVGMNKHRKRRVGKLRRNSKRKLDRLVYEQGGVCYWCANEIIPLRCVPRLRKNESHRAVTFWDNRQAKWRTVRKASVDHVRPLSEGGGNEISNLVAACIECNGRRNGLAQKILSGEPVAVGTMHELALADQASERVAEMAVARAAQETSELLGCQRLGSGHAEDVPLQWWQTWPRSLARLPRSGFKR